MMLRIIVASRYYQGTDADLYCDGTNDEAVINEAIRLASSSMMDATIAYRMTCKDRIPENPGAMDD